VRVQEEHAVPASAYVPVSGHETNYNRDVQLRYSYHLCVTGLARTRLAGSVHDAGWPAFTAMLEYKARRYGRQFHRIGRFEPTSQVCSA